MSKNFLQQEKNQPFMNSQTKIEKRQCFHASGCRMRFFFDDAMGYVFLFFFSMWPTIFIDTTAEILQSFSFNFLLWSRGLPSHSTNFSFLFFCLFCMKECCDCSLVEKIFKKEKFVIYIYNKSVNESVNQTI